MTSTASPLPSEVKSRRLRMSHMVLASLVLIQAVTAGGFISGGLDTHYLHTVGGSALPLIATVITVAAWVAAGRGTWERRSAVLSTIATVLIWVETGLGHMPMPVTTAVHVPLGVALFGLLLILGHSRRSPTPAG